MFPSDVNRFVCEELFRPDDLQQLQAQSIDAANSGTASSSDQVQKFVQRNYSTLISNFICEYSNTNKSASGDGELIQENSVKAAFEEALKKNHETKPAQWGKSKDNIGHPGSLTKRYSRLNPESILVADERYTIRFNCPENVASLASGSSSDSNDASSSTLLMTLFIECPDNNKVLRWFFCVGAVEHREELQYGVVSFTLDLRRSTLFRIDKLPPTCAIRKLFNKEFALQQPANVQQIKFVAAPALQQIPTPVPLQNNVPQLAAPSNGLFAAATIQADMGEDLKHALLANHAEPTTNSAAQMKSNIGARMGAPKRKRSSTGSSSSEQEQEEEAIDFIAIRSKRQKTSSAAIPPKPLPLSKCNAALFIGSENGTWAAIKFFKLMVPSQQ